MLKYPPFRISTRCSYSELNMDVNALNLTNYEYNHQCTFSYLDHGEESLSILVIDQAVVEDPIDLVDPEPDELLGPVGPRGDAGGVDEEDALYHAGKVSQVEDVVGLGRGGQEDGDGLGVHLSCGMDNDLKEKKREVIRPPYLMECCDYSRSWLPTLFFLLQNFWVKFSRHGVGVSLYMYITILSDKQPSKKIFLKSSFFRIPKSWGGGGGPFDIGPPPFSNRGGHFRPFPPPPLPLRISTHALWYVYNATGITKLSRNHGCCAISPLSISWWAVSKPLLKCQSRSGCEDALHRLLAERVDGDDVEVGAGSGAWRCSCPLPGDPWLTQALCPPGYSTLVSFLKCIVPEFSITIVVIQTYFHLAHITGVLEKID